MLRNFIKIALRNLGRNKVSSVINIGGLAIGMSVAMLIGLWMYSELSFDKNFRQYDRIAMVMQNQTFAGEVQTSGNQAMQLGPELRNTYGANFKQVVTASGKYNTILSHADKRIRQEGRFMEPGVIDLLSLHLLRGSRSALDDMNSILLSASTARAFFGNDEAIGKVVKIRDELNVKVTGVYEDLPVNSSFAGLHFIAPWQLLVAADNLEKRVTWGNSWFNVFVLIADNTTMEKVSAAIRYSKWKRVMEEDDDARFKPEVFLHPMRKWHLYDEFRNGFNIGGDIQYVWLFGITGAIVLLLACINFMNLSTARSGKRAKEVGIRKSIGFMRGQLIGQFFCESMLVALLAFVLALLPCFNEVAGKEMTLPVTEPLFV